MIDTARLKLVPTTVALALLCGSSSAFAGPNAGGTLIVHATGVAYSAGIPFYPTPAPDCGGVVNNAPVATPTVWKVYAAFPSNSLPRLIALNWGIEMTAGVEILKGGLSDWLTGVESGQDGWPHASGAGIRMTFGTVQTARVVECYWFGGYAADSLQSFRTAGHPTQRSIFLSDDSRAGADPIAGYSTVGFGHNGETYCPGLLTPGACCLAGDACQLLVPADCQAAGGLILGGACEPNPCGQLPPEWGACCYQNGRCLPYSWPEWCGATGGTFVDGPCHPNPCTQPPQRGACCLPDGSCLALAFDPCICVEGAFQEGTCEPTACSKPVVSACCHRDGSCTMTIPYTCSQILGSIQEGSCEPSPCPQLPPSNGACCLDGRCEIRLSTACLSPGTFRGLGTTCSPDPCVAQPCDAGPREGDLLEGEPDCVDGYVDSYNSGCHGSGWISLHLWTPATISVSGRSCTYFSYGQTHRDEDWYACTTAFGGITVSCEAEFPVDVSWFSNTDCGDPVVDTFRFPACGGGSVSRVIPANTETWIMVTPTATQGVPQGYYRLTLRSGLIPVVETSWGSIKARYLAPKVGRPPQQEE